MKSFKSYLLKEDIKDILLSDYKNKLAHQFQHHRDKIQNVYNGHQHILLLIVLWSLVFIRIFTLNNSCSVESIPN